MLSNMARTVVRTAAARPLLLAAPTRPALGGVRAFAADYAGTPAEQKSYLTWFEGGRKGTLADVPRDPLVTETSSGVTLGPVTNNEMGDTFGMYAGVIEPGGRIGKEIHASSTETIIVLEGEGRGLIGDTQFDMKSGDVMHVEKNTFHGLENVGTSDMVSGGLVCTHRSSWVCRATTAQPCRGSDSCHRVIFERCLTLSAPSSELW